MSKLVTIFGGSGFVGRYIARRMAKEGWRVRVAVRRPNEALFVRPYGVVGQVEPIWPISATMTACARRCMVRMLWSIASASWPKAERTRFNNVQQHGAARIARIAAEEGVARMVHISAIGADSGSDSEYAKTKAKGEAAVLTAMPQAVILRPSIIFGAEDQFFNRFAGMTRFGPVLPVVGANTRFQPVHVDDVAQAAVMGVLGQAKPGVYELGGPEVATFRQLMERMLRIIRRRRLIVNVPFPVRHADGRCL
jgi:uncharacterized protein YbjT (DUF2867 family)